MGGDMRSKRHAKLMAIIAGAFAAMAMLSPAAQAVELNPGYQQFAGCPDPFSENSNIVTCLRSDITGGNFKMGNKNVPIANPIAITGGVENELKNFTYNSEG